MDTKSYFINVGIASAIAMLGTLVFSKLFSIRLKGKVKGKDIPIAPKIIIASDATASKLNNIAPDAIVPRINIAPHADASVEPITTR